MDAAADSWFDEVCDARAGADELLSSAAGTLPRHWRQQSERRIAVSLQYPDCGLP